MLSDPVDPKDRGESKRASGTHRVRQNCRRPSRRILFVLLGVIALLVLVGVGVVLVRVLDTRGPRDLAEAQAEARAAGLPIDYSDPLFQRYENATSLDRNAATIYTEAFDIVSELRGEKPNQNLPVVGTAGLPDDARTPLSPEMLSAIREHVSQRQRALELIHEASGVTPCLFPLQWEGPFTHLAHLSRARGAARLIALSVILHAEDGDPRAAISSTLDGLALARPLMEEPVFISNLVAFAINSITLHSVQRLLSRTDTPAEDLLSLQKAIEASAESLSIRAGLTGEIANGNEIFKMLMDGRLDLSAAEGGALSPDSTKLSAWRVWFLKGDLKGSNAEMIRMQVKLISAAENPTPEVLDGSLETTLDSQLAASRYSFAILARMNLPGELRSIQQCELARAMLRSGAACVAALRFRNDSGAWPDSLDELTPQYLAAVPLDPFTAKPLIYRVREDGILVYSVGKNGKDEGGKVSLIKPDESDTWACDDFGFRIWR